MYNKYSKIPIRDLRAIYRFTVKEISNSSIIYKSNPNEYLRALIKELKQVSELIYEAIQYRENWLRYKIVF